MLADNNEPKINFDGLQDISGSRRRTQLLLALALLLMALVLVVMRNWQFWVDALRLEEFTNQTTFDAVKKEDVKTRRAGVRKGSAKQISPPAAPREHAEVVPEPDKSEIAPFQVDVTYANGKHKILTARNASVHVDLQGDSHPPVEMAGKTALDNVGTETAGGGQDLFSTQAVPVVVRRVEPVYPLLAQKEHVQGVVVLQAQIDRDGKVQAVQVLSGPDILTSAALEAIRQWRFKPHYEGDRATPVETRITVHFTISAQ